MAGQQVEPQLRRATAELSVGGAGDSQSAQASPKTLSVISCGQAGRAGAVTIATNMAGRGTDIILGGNDYMARLKLREVLLGRLVKPEEDHKPTLPLQRSTPAGFTDAPVSVSTASRDTLYPCALSDATDEALGQLARDLVKAWGDRALTVIELEERIATAAEKAPTDDPQIQALREAIAVVKGEYDAVVKQEEDRVRQAGGLHVIGTDGMNPGG